MADDHEDSIALLQAAHRLGYYLGYILARRLNMLGAEHCIDGAFINNEVEILILVL